MAADNGKNGIPYLGNVQDEIGRALTRPGLKRCPNPNCAGGKPLAMSNVSGVVFNVWCRACDMQGPAGDTAEHARDEWQMLLRASSTGMTRVCACCGEVLGIRPASNERPGLTHGTCMSCARRLYGDQIADEILRAIEEDQDRGEGQSPEPQPEAAS
jgi:hypothetical protein